MDNLEEQPESNQKKLINFNVYVLIFCLIILAAILTYVVPAGQFERAEVDGRSVIQPETFQYIDANPVGLLDIFSSIHSGMVNGANTTKNV